MIMTNDEVESRLNSPDNLINKLKDRLSGSSFVNQINSNQTELDRNQPSSAIIPDIVNTGSPKLEDLMPSAADKIKMNLIQSSAMDVLSDSLTELRYRLPEVDKPKELSKIASEMSRIVGNMTTAKNDGANPIGNQVIIWKPIMVTENHYQQIEVTE